MSSTLLTDDQIEKEIRKLQRVNKECSECREMGPQYVDIDHLTFVCTSCSGLLREFSFRVKSVSMSKFTIDEVNAIKERGGNERAKALYLPRYQLSMDGPLPEASEKSKIREFIKLKYISKKWMKKESTSSSGKGKKKKDDDEEEEEGEDEDEEDIKKKKKKSKKKKDSSDEEDDDDDDKREKEKKKPSSKMVITLGSKTNKKSKNDESDESEGDDKSSKAKKSKSKKKKESSDEEEDDEDSPKPKKKSSKKSTLKKKKLSSDEEDDNESENGKHGKDINLKDVIKNPPKLVVNVNNKSNGNDSSIGFSGFGSFPSTTAQSFETPAFDADFGSFFSQPSMPASVQTQTQHPPATRSSGLGVGMNGGFSGFSSNAPSTALPIDDPFALLDLGSPGKPSPAKPQQIMGSAPTNLFPSAPAQPSSHMQIPKTIDLHILAPQYQMQVFTLYQQLLSQQNQQQNQNQFHQQHQNIPQFHQPLNIQQQQQQNQFPTTNSSHQTKQTSNPFDDF